MIMVGTVIPAKPSASQRSSVADFSLFRQSYLIYFIGSTDLAPNQDVNR